MAKVSKINIRQYKSIKELELVFPEKKPLILVGENNVGKSNILKAIDLVLGEYWPRSYEPEENDFYNRDSNHPIKIEVEFSEDLGRFKKITWEYNNSLDNDQKVRFKGFDNLGQEFSPRNEDRENLICIYIGADRRLSYQLSYKSKSTFLSKLMHRFHKSIQNNQEIRSKLEGQFKEIKELFLEISEFKEFRDSLRKDFSDFIKGMTHRLEIDFEAYNPINFFHALRAQVDEGGIPRTIEELGTGEEQILAIAFAHAYAKAFHRGVMLAIEEPESNLHPLAQEYLARKIQKIAEDGLQIIITTHNPAFISMLNIDGICIVRKDKERGTYLTQISKKQLVNYCIQKGVSKDKIREDNIAGFYHANSTKQILEGFFAKKIILAEGPTESLSLPIYLEVVGLDTKKEGIAIIPVMGKGNISKWWRLFTIYKIPVYVIFDNDKEDDKDENHRRDILKTLGEQNVQEILGTNDILIKNRYTVFGKDFETSLRSVFPNYSKFEEEAKEIIKSGAKPFTARYVATKLSEIKGEEEGWSKFENIKEKILSLPEPLGLSEIKSKDRGVENFEFENIPYKL